MILDDYTEGLDSIVSPEDEEEKLLEGAEENGNEEEDNKVEDAEDDEEEEEEELEGTGEDYQGLGLDWHCWAEEEDDH